MDMNKTGNIDFNVFFSLAFKFGVGVAVYIIAFVYADTFSDVYRILPVILMPPFVSVLEDEGKTIIKENRIKLVPLLMSFVIAFISFILAVSWLSGLPHIGIYIDKHLNSATNLIVLIIIGAITFVPYIWLLFWKQFHD